MKELIKNVEQAIVESNTYMDVESKTNELDFFLSTRENGDVGNETPSVDDINEAKRVQKVLQSKFPELKISISTTDEWTNLRIQKPKPIVYKYQYDLYKPGKTDFMAGQGGGHFDDFNEMVKSLEDPYVSQDSALTALKGINWKSIKEELDSITEFPKYSYHGWYRSKLIPLAMVGEFGNKRKSDIYVSRIRME